MELLQCPPGLLCCEPVCVFSGGSVPSGVPGSLPPGASAVLRHPQSQLTGTSAADRYAALAELDNVFGSSAPTTSVYNTISTSQGYENTPSDEFTLFPLPSSLCLEFLLSVFLTFTSFLLYKANFLVPTSRSIFKNDTQPSHLSLVGSQIAPYSLKVHCF